MSSEAELDDQNSTDLDVLAAHLAGLGDPPVLDWADTALPERLRNTLATFPGRKLEGIAGSGRPQIDQGRAELTLVLTCAAQAWPADAMVATTVQAATVTVSRRGEVTVTLDGRFDGIAVVVTLNTDKSGGLTAAVRSQNAGAFTVDTLVGTLAGNDAWRAVESGLADLGLERALGQVTGFDYRLGKDLSAEPVGYVVTSAAVATAFTLRDFVLDVELWLPDLYLTGGLHEHEPIGVAQLLGSFGLPVTHVPTDLTVAQLNFAVGLGDTYRITTTLTGDWSIGHFTLQDVSASIAYNTFEKFVARFSGTARLGSVPVAISAAKSSGAAGGWTFEGGIPANDELTMGALLEHMGLTGAPKPVETLALSSLWFSYTTGSGRFAASCRGELEIADGITASVGIAITRDETGTRYEGSLSVGELELDLFFDAERGIDAFVATYRNADGGAVALREWVAAVSTDLAADIPESLRVGLTDAKFVRVKPAAGPAVFAVGFDLSAGIDLGQLPLIGGFLSEVGTLGVDNLQILYSTAAIDATTSAALDALLARAKVVPLPSGGLTKGLAVQAVLRIGANRTPVALGLPAASSQRSPSGTPSSAAPTPDMPTDPPGSGPATPNTPAPQSTTSVWLQVQKQLGVLHVNRVGMLYQDNALMFALDAAVTLGPLKLSFDGLAVGSPLDKFVPTFSLSGLGVAVDTPSLTISGGLLHVPNPAAGIEFQYDGTAVIAGKSFALAAIGSYAQLTGGDPSLFIFAQLNAELGEPPVVVSALMAGFGFNRELVVPTAREVPNFPLLALNGQGQEPTHVLDVLEGRAQAAPGSPARQWIPPSKGSYWLGVGAELTLFEVVKTKLMLVAEFGHELIFTLLGTATLQLPLAGQSPHTYVYAELGLQASLRPAQGTLTAQAQLSDASYVLVKDCHLTGGFAAAVWFGSNPNAGQFVVTLGGYHPRFDRPSYYPVVPRLGIRWAPSTAVSVAAEAYLAVTPSCAMAGARLDVVFHEGPVRAWFTAHADLLVSWHPFSFIAEIGVSIGASVRVDALFCHGTLSVTVGARLTLWGPPTGGSVTVHLVVFTVTIGFGADPDQGQTTPLDWAQLAGMLPKREQVVTLTPVSGLDTTVPDIGAGEPSSGGRRWLMRARDLRFVTGSAIPASQLRMGDELVETGADIDVRPMNQTGLAGMHRLSVRHGDRPVEGWTVTARRQNLAASLWGAPPVPFSHRPAEPSADTVADLLVGCAVQAPRPVLAASRGVFPLSAYDAEEIPPGLSPLPLHPEPNSDHVFTPDPAAVRLIGDVDTDPVRSRREQVFAALADAGLLTGPSDGLAELASGVGHLYSQAPMIRKAGNPT
ncbi:DUF6603 domain-containing protein [Nocardia barduliensis]|uniref:DUF6603 domain-containing protein n=1 Tax=Nocardia barduliensis TaxID=2736643 RepID=UPI0015720DA0|nr:DUF6603 domain-containing protein [Nocardia barduliensis]